MPASVALLVALPVYSDQHGLGSRPRLARSFVSGYSSMRLNSWAGTEGSTVSSLNCDRWLILSLGALSH